MDCNKNPSASWNQDWFGPFPLMLKINGRSCKRNTQWWTKVVKCFVTAMCMVHHKSFNPPIWTLCNGGSHLKPMDTSRIVHALKGTSLEINLNSGWSCWFQSVQLLGFDWAAGAMMWWWQHFHRGGEIPIFPGTVRPLRRPHTPEVVIMGCS